MHLNVTKSQKRAVITLFLLGGLYVVMYHSSDFLSVVVLTEGSVCVASIMRLVAVITQKDDVDISWNIVNQSIWATVEANFAIISGAFLYFPSIKVRSKCSSSQDVYQPCDRYG